jgi:hypothetical protein
MTHETPFLRFVENTLSGCSSPPRNMTLGHAQLVRDEEDRQMRIHLKGTGTVETSIAAMGMIWRMRKTTLLPSCCRRGMTASSKHGEGRKSSNPDNRVVWVKGNTRWPRRMMKALLTVHPKMSKLLPSLDIANETKENNTLQNLRSYGKQQGMPASQRYHRRWLSV